MFLRDVGAGPAILLLHGTPSPAADWAPLVEQLAPRFRVLVPDLPGYGTSPLAEDAAYAVVDQELAALLAARGVTRLHAIAGFSSGAYRAFEMVLRGRVVADRVIGLGAFATLDDDGRALRRTIAAQLDAEPAHLHSAEIGDMLRQLMLAPAWAAAHPADLEGVFAWVNNTSAAALAAELRAMAALDDLRPELPALDIHVYLRVGALDVGCPPAASTEICALLPRCTLDIVPGCGHSLLIEDRDATLAAIDRALA